MEHIANVSAFCKVSFYLNAGKFLPDIRGSIPEHSIVHSQLRKNIKSCRIDGRNINKASLRPISEVCHVGIIDSILKGTEIEVPLVHYIYIQYHQKLSDQNLFSGAIRSDLLTPCP